MQFDKQCFLCGRNGSSDRLEKHHIFGASNRNRSEMYGLTVWLCGANCHRLGQNSVHMNKYVANELKRQGQAKYEELYGTREDFVRDFGRNYDI